MIALGQRVEGIFLFALARPSKKQSNHRCGAEAVKVDALSAEDVKMRPKVASEWTLAMRAIWRVCSAAAAVNAEQFA